MDMKETTVIWTNMIVKMYWGWFDEQEMIPDQMNIFCLNKAEFDVPVPGIPRIGKFPSSLGTGLENIWTEKDDGGRLGFFSLSQ